MLNQYKNKSKCKELHIGFKDLTTRGDDLCTFLKKYQKPGALRFAPVPPQRLRKKGKRAGRRFFASLLSDSFPLLLADYTKYLTAYTETMAKMNAISDDELSDAEAAYYLEVSTRITQKLLEVVE